MKKLKVSLLNSACKYKVIETKNIDCKNISEIIKIFEILNFHNIVLITEHISKDTDFYKFVCENNLMSVSTFEKANSNIVETVTVIPENCLGTAIKLLLDDDQDFMFFFNLEQITDWQQYLYNSNYLNDRKLLNNNLSAVALSIVVHENVIRICISPDIYNIEEILSKLNNIN